MKLIVRGGINIAAFLGISADELRDAILYEQAPVLVMDGQFYASASALTHWLTSGAPDLGESQPGRDAYVATAFDQAHIVAMEKAS